uniref:Uncharacterized protein n=1 Tax=Bactrocera dorsalis TaxID=27457 RepID=A0A034V947_BACDO
MDNKKLTEILMSFERQQISKASSLHKYFTCICFCKFKNFITTCPMKIKSLKDRKCNYNENQQFNNHHKTVINKITVVVKINSRLSRSKKMCAKRKARKLKKHKCIKKVS